MKLRTALSASALLLVTLVAGCGVDGPPQAPEAKPGVTISGDARIGATYTR